MYIIESTERLVCTLWRAHGGWCAHYGEHREAAVHIIESTGRLVAHYREHREADAHIMQSTGRLVCTLWRAQGGWCVHYGDHIPL